MPTIRLALLGPPQIYLNQQPVELSIAKLHGLLAYLAVTHQSQTRDHLLALLWAESDGAAARKNLRNRLWQLRQMLGAEVVTVAGNRLLLAAGVESDVVTFEQGLHQQLQGQALDVTTLQSLVDLWRGPLLEGIHLNEAPEFELWLTTVREQLGQLYLRGLTTLIEWRRQAGDWEQVLLLVQRGLRFDPLHEPLYQEAIYAHTQRGERSEALRQYDHLHALLQTELGVEPAPETVALRHALLKNTIERSTLRQRSFVITDPSPPATHHLSVANRHAPPTPFIGRQTQLAALDRAWQQAQLGQCRVVLVSGELGIGKSRFWQTWATPHVANQTVLEMRALNTTQPVPFDPIRRLLQSSRLRNHFAAVVDTLLPVWRSELLRLAPGLQQTSAVNQTSDLLTPAEESRHVSEALTQFLRTLAATPLILFVDDLHWADAATLNWLLYLSDRMHDEPLLLVGAYRPSDAPATLRHMVNQWQREGLLQRIELPHFTVEEATQLLAALGGNVTQAAYLHSQSGGNPYYLAQLSDVAVNGVPAGLADLVRARIDSLAAEQQRMVQAAAVLEPTIDLDTLHYMLQRSEDETVDMLDGLLAAAVLVEREATYEFSHPLVATVVREGLSNSRRKILHRRAAEWLSTRFAENQATVAGELARHFAEAGDRGQAAHFAEVAGDQALQIGAATEAAAFYQQALGLIPTATRRLGLGTALFMLAGQVHEGRALLQQAVTEFEAQGDYLNMIKAGVRLAFTYLVQLDSAMVLHWAQRILPDLATVNDPALQAQVHYLLGTAKFRTGDSMLEAEAHYRAAAQLVSTHQIATEIALMIWFEWGNLYLEWGDYALAIEKFQQTSQMAQSCKNVLYETLPLNNLAYTKLLTGAIEEAQELVKVGLALVETYAFLGLQQFFHSTHGEILLALNELDAAEQAFQRALSLAEKTGDTTFAANVRAHLARVAQARGDLADALRLLIAAQAAVPPAKAPYLQSQLDLWLTALYLQRGEVTEAAQSLHRVEERLSRGQYRLLLQRSVELGKKLQSAQGE